MTEIAAGLLVLTGAVFSLIASIGLIRMPDIFTRMHASTKAGVLGSSLILIAAGVVIGDGGTWARIVVAIFFLLLTAPIGAHMIGRASLDEHHRPRHK
ncbi:Na+/H+ antiporter subunit G [Alphaproteobacteria bacterium GH1-50]|uniref:Na+/H+ antiporter subunit G n=1 Tax=Kangsaoukella pontilimi TaxID=2691042 RepID=A0A7C9J5M3_9RHOB|nr:monovalent cation/H(+) antiporter subunit G [Kangsaoukella pontilimi]MXQ09461.1 Na+/H+ antiporter subunit G [Kangsaoukella pontilimi]